MPLPQSFPLSAFQIRDELRMASTESISMLSAAVRTLAGQPTGDVKFSELLGKTNYNTKETFSYTGNVQTFVVPSGVYSVRIKCWGAGGGCGFNSLSGGRGGYSQSEFLVQPADVLALTVGGGGVSGTLGNIGGFGGGGNSSGGGGSGGGLCSVILNISGRSWGIYSGGGGGTNDGNSTNGGLFAGNGGGANISGGNAVNAASYLNGGKGGTVSAGGLGGVDDTGFKQSEDGSSLKGGNASSYVASSGGGGSGYYGGGGGGGPFGSGGGGSGYVLNGTNVLGDGGGVGGSVPYYLDTDYPGGSIGEGSNGYNGQAGHAFAVIRY